MMTEEDLKAAEAAIAGCFDITSDHKARRAEYDVCATVAPALLSEVRRLRQLIEGAPHDAQCGGSGPCECWKVEAVDPSKRKF